MQGDGEEVVDVVEVVTHVEDDARCLERLELKGDSDVVGAKVTLFHLHPRLGREEGVHVLYCGGKVGVWLYETMWEFVVGWDLEGGL